MEDSSKWMAWPPGRKPFGISPKRLISRLSSQGIKWLRRKGVSGDYPIFNVTKAVQQKYGVYRVEDLDNVPFSVLWPR